MKRSWLAGVVALALFAAGNTRAQTAATRFVFTSVDAVRMGPPAAGLYSSTPMLFVTGVLEGAAAATEEAITGNAYADLPECRRLALIAMSKPGQYRLSLAAIRGTTTSGASYLYASDCKLARVTP